MANDTKEMAISPKTTYKGQPLLRSGNTVYYGDPSCPYMAMLQIMSTKEMSDVTLSDKVIVQIVSTDDSLPMPARIVKKTEKNGLYSALAIAAIWLERQLKDNG